MGLLISGLIATAVAAVFVWIAMTIHIVRVAVPLAVQTPQFWGGAVYGWLNAALRDVALYSSALAITSYVATFAARAAGARVTTPSARSTPRPRSP